MFFEIHTKENGMAKRVVFMNRPKTKVYLSPIEKSDLPLFAKYLSDETIANFLGHHSPVTSVDEEKWYENLGKNKENNKAVAIILKETDEAIGVMGFHRINWIDRTAFSGAFIGREDLLGSGFGTEAKMLWLKYAFLTLNLRQIHSCAYDFNARSIRYSEKCGYKKIAIYPDFIFRNGEYHDLVHLMVNREMWQPLWDDFEIRMKGETDV